MRIGAEELLRRLEARGFADEAASLSARSLGQATVSADGESPPQRLGGFEIVGELGQGAYGTVLLAMQERPVRRLAAIKLLKRGMDSRSVLARFRGEQQALAMMDHRAVATVFETGLAEDGRPWFAMPLVTGVSLTQHCDLEGVGLQGRLQLFREAAEGVLHAHRKGVIHRDLKPGNILVGVEGDAVQPRVIDFGIAKSVDGADPLTSLATLEGMPLGTPAYMAPEQARGMADVRSDVWSLGVILGELLSGWRPLDREPSRGADGVIRTGLFRRPSEVVRDRIRAEPAEVREAASRRGMAPGSLVSALQGDLDAIVGRCLEEEPSRRYAGVDALLQDIDRHLDGRAVSARPPSVLYRLRRFTRRHQVLVTATGIVMATLTAATVASVRAAARAEAEARAADAVTSFVVDMLGAADPWKPGGQGDLTVRAAIEAAEARLRRDEFAGRSLERARITLAVGLARLQLGMAAEALPWLETAERELGRLDPQGNVHAEALHRLGVCLQAIGRPAEALPPLERALALQDAGSGPESTAAIRVLNDLGLALLDAGDAEGAERRLREALGRLERSPEADRAQLAGTQGNLGMLLQGTGRLEDARPFLEATLRTNLARLGPDDLELSMDWNNLGLLEKDLGAHADAERSLRRALEILERGVGRTHPNFALVQVNLADLMQRSERVEEAVTLLAEARATIEAAYGDKHPELARVSNQLGFAQIARSDFTGAEGSFRRALRVWRATLGPDHPDVATAFNNLARAIQEQGRFADALPPSTEAVAIASRTMTETDPRRWVFLGRNGSILARMERPVEADAALRDALAGLRAVSAPPSRVRPVLQDLLRCAEAMGDAAAAQRWSRELAALPSS